VLPQARYLQLNIDEPGDLVVSGCEWHISPQGRSYFVNHNIRTTSWKKPIPECPAGSLTPECIIEGHSECIWSLACTSNICQHISNRLLPAPIYYNRIHRRMLLTPCGLPVTNVKSVTELVCVFRDLVVGEFLSYLSKFFIMTDTCSS
jgi:hypothetical protein